MIRIGVTGGIGSGKTRFCQFLQSLGAYVVYADDFAKELMVTDPVVKANLKAVFGDETYLDTGELNKSHLIREAFEKGRVEELNAVVHPQLRIRTKELADKLDKEGHNVFVYEAAVLLNEGRPDNFDHIVLLLANEELRTNRVVERDDTDPKLVLDRIQSQPDFESLRPIVDHIIVNDGDLDDLQKAADEFYRSLF